MDEEIISSEALSGEGDIAPSAGDEPDSTVSVKELLSQALGKNFSSDESALKFVKDNVSYVGKVRNYQPVIQKVEAKYGSQSEALKAMEQILNDSPKETPKETVVEQPKPVDTKDYVSRAEFEAATFYAKRPELEAHQELLSAISAAKGISIADAANTDAFKSVFEKATAYEQIEKSKSVLQTNSRLGQVTDNLEKAREASAQGNTVEAAKSATAAVIEAYGMK